MSENSLSGSPSSIAASSPSGRRERGSGPTTRTIGSEDGSPLRRQRKGLSRRSLVRKAGEASLRTGSGNLSHEKGKVEEEDRLWDFGADGKQEDEGNEAALEGAERESEVRDRDRDHDEGLTGNGIEGWSLDESEMRMQLGEIESSFLPDLTAVAAAGKPEENQEVEGQDDTYLELADPGRTPGVRSRDYTREDEDDEDDEEGMLGDSPTAAAAERSHIRGALAGGTSARQPSSTSAAPQPGSRNATIRAMPSFQPLEDAPLLPLPQSSMLSPDSIPTTSGDRRSAQRNGLANRQASYQSVDSSLTMGSDISSSDGTMNAETGPQARGASSSNATGRTSRRKNLLQRLPSLGSVSSQMTGDDARDAIGPSLLATRLRNRAAGHNDDDRPETPRANASNFRAPTDTVVTKHVQSIQVPDTIARDFMARNQPLSPEKRPTSAGGLVSALRDRPKKTLTLKEQNNKIDKLTKDNFDLKLKIHFLDQALQNRSDDGIKDLIEQNVQFQTDLANERKESQSLRRKVKDMERKLREQEEGLAEARNGGFAKDGEYEDPTLQGEMHEEILYLRQQLDRSENQVTTLREEVMTKEFEKRKMAEHMRNMAGKRGEDTTGMKETMDMWQDLLNAETRQREQAEEDLSKLRDELNALRIERASPNSRRTDLSNGLNGARAASNTGLLEQLKHENSELRRDLGAQTSMLTSRNRERERLQQEIEELKLMFRKGDGARSVIGESVFDRSISRAHQRSISRASARTDVTEAERDDWEKKEGLLRDQNAELRIKYQELERTHNTHLQYVAVLEGDYREMETDLGEIQEDLLKMQSERDEALHAYDQQETEYEQLREEALAEISALDYDKKMLEAQLEDAIGKAHRLQTKLQNTSDGYKGVQGELREITQSVINLEDEKQANLRTIQDLEQQIAEAEEEIQTWERKCSELDEKNRKLEVTQESLHSEITFLREEQEGDKIKIGELEDALNAAKQNLQDEHDRMRDMEASILEERQQRDVLEDQSKEEVQKVLDDLNSENTKTKDEVRQLRRSLSAKEVEVSTWKQRLDEFETNLRDALGVSDGTRHGLLAEIEKLQRDLENTASELDRANMDLADKDRLLRHRDGLLESTSLESRRLSDLLDKERASRKHDLDQFDKASRGQATHVRTIAQQESRLLELETTYGQDKRKMVTLEQQYRDQLRERNNLLLALWNRLSTLCGVEWAQNHSLVHGENPSIEVINRHLSGFSSNIIAAVKTIETLIGNFKVRIRGIDRDLSRDYHNLEHTLDLRLRQIEALERTAKETQKTLEEYQPRHAASSSSSSASLLTRTLSHAKTSKNTEEISRLKSEVKLLKSELKASRRQIQQQQQQQQPPLPSSSSSQPPASTRPHRTPSSPSRILPAFLHRHNNNNNSSSSSTAPAPAPPGPDPSRESATAQALPTALALPRSSTDAGTDAGIDSGPGSGAGAGPGAGPSAPGSTSLDARAHGPAPATNKSEHLWRIKYANLERRLLEERARYLAERDGIRKRVGEAEARNGELREALERERAKVGGVGGDR